MGDFLAGLDGRVGVNVMAYVGHCAIRRFVMGEAASERTATDHEIVVMQQLLTRSLDEGGIGLSTSQLDIHSDHEGRPVPSNLADHRELEALASVLADRVSGALEIFPRSFVPGVDDADRRLLLRLAQVSGKPVHGNVLGYFAAAPDGWRRNLEVAEEARDLGLRYYPMLVINPKGVHFALDSTFIFDEYPMWRTVLTTPDPARRALLADPSTRTVLRVASRPCSIGSPTSGPTLACRSPRSADSCSAPPSTCVRYGPRRPEHRGDGSGVLWCRRPGTRIRARPVFAELQSELRARPNDGGGTT